MFKDLIYKENKVFSSPLKRSESIAPVLSTIRQKEDLGTAILLLEGEGITIALFILENKLYAPYYLDDPHFRPLLFSDYFKEASRRKTKAQLYQVSPVLFKCLLILAQYSPSVVGSPTVIGIEKILGHIKEQKQEAVLIFKQKPDIQVFYFLNGNVRDTYFSQEKGIKVSSGLNEQLIAAASQDNGVRMELFEETKIEAASDRETAEQIITETQTKTAQNNEEDGTNEALLSVKVLCGSRAGFLIRFSSEPISLGRGNVAIRLNDPQVSRFHAELAWGKDGLFIRDNHSTNGIFVNDKKVYRKTLMLNDLIRLGDVRLKVVRGS